MLRQKSEVFGAFKKYKRRIEKERLCDKVPTNGQRKAIFIKRIFTQFLESEGIRRQLSIEYISQQNGVAKRANRTLIEKARSLVIQASFPESLWAKTINAPTYISPFASKRETFREPQLSAITDRGIIHEPAAVFYYQ